MTLFQIGKRIIRFAFTGRSERFSFRFISRLSIGLCDV